MTVTVPLSVMYQLLFKAVNGVTFLVDLFKQYSIYRSVRKICVHRFLVMKLKLSIIIPITVIMAIMVQFETAGAIQWEDVTPGIRRSTHCDFPGTELKETRTENLTDCGKSCKFSWDCTHFVWNQNGNCWIKTGFVSDDTAKAISDPHTVCGHLIILWQNSTQQDDIIWSYNCNFTSDRILENKISSSVDCRSMCHANPQCTHFVWRVALHVAGFCQMKFGNVSRNDAVINSAWGGSTCGFQKEKEIAFAEDATIKWENVEPGIRRSTHCDFPGTELIRTVRSTNLTECENKCQFTDGCTHFVWNQNGTCWIKTGSASDNTAKAISDPNTVCGHLIILWKFSSDLDDDAWSFNCDFPSDREFKALPSKGDDCGNLCRTTPPCSYFTWTNHKSEGGMCRLKYGDISRNDAILTPGSRGIGSTCGFQKEKKTDATKPVTVVDVDKCDCDCSNTVF